MPDCIAVINAGSSSVKFTIYAPGDALTLYRGQVEGIGTSPHLRIVPQRLKPSQTAPGPPTVSITGQRRGKSYKPDSSSCRAGLAA